jgi:hypothetical protein
VRVVLYALLFLPALAGIVYVVLRRRPRVLEEAVPEAGRMAGKAGAARPEDRVVFCAPPNPFATLEGLLGELERKTLDERAVAELEALAAELEAAAARLERVR